MEQEEFQTLVRLLKAIADESRLKLLGLIADKERSVGEIAELLELKEPTVSHHLSKLQELGLVQPRAEGTMRFYRLNVEVLRRLNRDLLTPEKVASIADDVEGDAWERKVLQTFFDGEQLIKIPDTRKKRAVILKWLVKQFEIGVRYPEPQLNAILKRYHPDTATIRREFIANKLMQRENGVYWRTESNGKSLDK